MTLPRVVDFLMAREFIERRDRQGLFDAKEPAAFELVVESFPELFPAHQLFARFERPARVFEYQFALRLRIGEKTRLLGISTFPEGCVLDWVIVPSVEFKIESAGPHYFELMTGNTVIASRQLLVVHA